MIYLRGMPKEYKILLENYIVNISIKAKNKYFETEETK